MNATKKSIDVIFIVLTSLIQTYFFFYIIYPEFYINGDNEFYQRAYDVISNLGLLNAYPQFVNTGGSGTEPVSFLILFLFSKIISYENYFLFSNFIFISTFGLFLSRFFSFYKLSFLLLSFSFYIFIASSLTQRLSIGILFWMCSEMTKKNRVLLGMSILSHWQMILVILNKIFIVLLNIFLKNKLNWYVLVVLFFIGVIFFSQSHSILPKIEYFLKGFHVNSIKILAWPILLILLGYKLNEYDASFFLVLFVVAIIISSGRINILCFFYSIFVLKGKSKKLLLFSIFMIGFSLYQHYGYFLQNYNPGLIYQFFS